MRIQGEAKIGQKGWGSFFKKLLLQTGRQQQQTECITMIYKYVRWSVVVFGSIQQSNFWHVNLLAYLQKCSLYSGERSVPLGALVFLCFPLVSSFVQVFQMLFDYPNILILYNWVRRYAYSRVHKIHNGHAFMISMNESKIYKRVRVTMNSLALFR